MTEPVTNPEILELRDIHLPDPISWWPPSLGWWLIIAAVILFTTLLLIGKKLYTNKQLKRDIKAELETIQQQFQKNKNKSQLAKSLSSLLRRACISYYPETSSAGLINENWLAYLDQTNKKSNSNTKFQSELGKILLTAPYLPDDNKMNFDANAFIGLCESWLLSSHKNKSMVPPS